MFLVALVYGVLYLPFVQTRLGQLGSYWLQSEYGISAEIERITFKPFTVIELQGVYVEDFEEDTLFHANFLHLDIDVTASSDYDIGLGRLEMKDATFYLNQQTDTTYSNLTQLIEVFAANANPTPDTTAGSVAIAVSAVNIDNLHFRYQVSNLLSEPGSKEINFSDVEVFRFKLDANDVTIFDDSISADVNQLALAEKTGFTINRLSGKAIVSGRQIGVEDMDLLTNKSHLVGKYSMTTNQWSDYSDYNQSVIMSANLDHSRLWLEDLNYFNNTIPSINSAIFVDGIAKGSLSNLRVSDLELKFYENTRFSGKINLIGLPEIEDTYIDMNAKALATTPRDLSLFFNEFLGVDKAKVPRQMEALGNMSYAGRFTGFVGDFVSNGSLQTDIGNIITDISIKGVQENVPSYKGKLVTKNLDLGKLLGMKKLGTLTSNVNVEGKGVDVNNLNAKTVGEVQSLVFNDYEYRGVSMDGTFSKQQFNGNINSKDPNINFDFSGLIDFNEKLPVFDFSAQLYNADLGALNLVNDSIYSTISADMELSLKGDKVENLDGDMFLKNIEVCYDDVYYAYHDLVLKAKNEPRNKSIKLESPFIDANIVGDFYPEEVHKNFINVVAEAIPALEVDKKELLPNQSFSFEIYPKNLDLIQQVVGTEIIVSEDAVLLGSLDQESQKLQVSIEASELGYGDVKTVNPKIISNQKDGVFNLDFYADLFQYGDSVKLKNTSFFSKATSNNAQSTLLWDNGERSSGSIELLAVMLGKGSFSVNILPSEFRLNNTNWAIKSNPEIHYDSTRFYVNNLALTSSDQNVVVNGRLSRFNSDRLKFQIDNFNIKPVSDFLGLTVPVKGIINGTAELSNPFENLNFLADLGVDNLTVGKENIGDFSFSADWNKRDSSVVIGLGLKKDGKNTFFANGLYYPFQKKNQVIASGQLNQFNLHAINAVVTEDVTAYSGFATGKFTVRGELSEPKINGSFNLDKASCTIQYLNTHYTASGKLLVRPEWFGFNRIAIKDQEENLAYATGTVFHENFKNFNYDVSLDADNFLGLNTNAYQNELFYGKAYATGQVSISGFGEDMIIEATVKNEDNTVLNIPLGGSEEVSSQEFVRFVNTGVEEKEEEEIDLSGIRLKLDVEVDPGAEIKLIFDESVGDVMTGTGYGRINMEITPTGDFKMYGKYEVEDGGYLFTLGKVINKRFKVNKGGQIIWYGDPYNAQIDLSTVYAVRAPLQNIMPSGDSRYSQKETVLVQMHLTNSLMEPEIEFNITVPDADDFAQGQINAALNNESNVNKQVFALLLTQNFTATQNGVQKIDPTASTFNTLTELVSNQLSNMFSSASSDLDVGVNINFGTEFVPSEYTVGFTYYKNRFTVSTDLGVREQLTSNTNNFIGDFSVKYRLTKDNRLNLNVFHQSTDNTYVSNYFSPYVQGVGLSYREEFDTLEELFNNVFRRKKRDNYVEKETEDETDEIPFEVN